MKPCHLCGKETKLRPNAVFVETKPFRLCPDCVKIWPQERKQRILARIGDGPVAPSFRLHLATTEPPQNLGDATKSLLGDVVAIPGFLVFVSATEFKEPNAALLGFAAIGALIHGMLLDRALGKAKDVYRSATAGWEDRDLRTLIEASPLTILFPADEILRIKFTLGRKFLTLPSMKVKCRAGSRMFVLRDAREVYRALQPLVEQWIRAAVPPQPAGG
jgi:hypothetical protein